MKISRVLLALAALVATVCLAAASRGLVWPASTTYEDDGKPLAAGEKVVYIVYDSTGKRVASTFATTVPGSLLPADGCYYVRAAFYATDTNSEVPGSLSVKQTETLCIKPPQKRAAAPASIGTTP